MGKTRARLWPVIANSYLAFVDFSKLNKQLLSLILVIAAVLGIALSVNVIKQNRYIGVDVTRLQTISFNGQGKATVKPDLATLTLSVVSDGARLKNVQDENAKRMNGILAFLDSEGIAKADRATSQYSISPQYDYTRTGRKFRGYEVRQALTVKIRDFSKISDILDQAVNKGANEVSGLRFTVENPDALQAEARSKAIAQAKAKARELAKQLGVTLGRVVNFSENNNTPQPVNFAASAPLGMGGGGESVPQIEPGQNEYTSNVTLTYQIEY